VSLPEPRTRRRKAILSGRGDFAIFVRDSGNSHHRNLLKDARFELRIWVDEAIDEEGLAGRLDGVDLALCVIPNSSGDTTAAVSAALADTLVKK
jgi:hypothetical protein